MKPILRTFGIIAAVLVAICLIGAVADRTDAQTYQSVNVTKTELDYVNGTALSAGQATMANSLPVVVASNQSSLPISVTNTAGTTDPCQNPSVLKSSAKITLTSTTAQELVTVSGATKIYVCGFAATIQGSATTVGTLQFEYGTKVTNGCDTGTTTLTDAFQGNIAANVPTYIVSPGGEHTQFATAASNELCAVATGTTISVKGFVTYVQQ